MSRLGQVRPRELISALKRFGFVEAGQIGSHRILVCEERDLQTSVPMHPGDIGRGLLKKILKQVGLSEDQFRKLL
jgi:predicted RNA binding protein YcfA (HicA-like mRNA interferase family)